MAGHDHWDDDCDCHSDWDCDDYCDCECHDPDDDLSFPPDVFRYVPAPRRAADGIRARSRRGDVGDTWWSRRFVDVLESFRIGARLARGKSYARSGQVLEVAVASGVVTSRVQGSRARPYRCEIRVLPLSDKDWQRVAAALAARAVFAAKLLNGEMPHEIEEAFAGLDLSLFPAGQREIATHCTCPDWSNPCKHIAASYYILAEAFDADPFLVFAWRGRTRDDLLAGLRSARGDAAPPPRAAPAPAGGAPPPPPPPAGPPPGGGRRGGGGGGPEIDTVEIHPAAAASPDAALRRLEPPDLAVRNLDLAEILRPAYARLTAGAERLAFAPDPD